MLSASSNGDKANAIYLILIISFITLIIFFLFWLNNKVKEKEKKNVKSEEKLKTSNDDIVQKFKLTIRTFKLINDLIETKKLNTKKEIIEYFEKSEINKLIEIKYAGNISQVGSKGMYNDEYYYGYAFEFNKDGQVDSIFEFDSQTGLMKCLITFHSNKNLESIIEPFYNEKGELVEEKNNIYFFNEDGILKQ